MIFLSLPANYLELRSLDDIFMIKSWKDSVDLNLPIASFKDQSMMMLSKCVLSYSFLFFYTL